ncbi:MAG: 50S ribosomal protein L18 [Armatimonadota bacterium]|nr:50S ribosomal protein L18 [Armatimonadota bacterium]MDR7452640.1 50S ribosomal protein L18 [Armatimonadota bacterium]MDR7468175.1 50S ribosomal protein L18 [Armatimonadota bacterium]MDR7495169.1 50S ribosomal protein L18 [Armatimonadota bacterium]MDR7499303.1 50S ribosomal protein L18 [Armatimonadota bacterium]
MLKPVDRKALRRRRHLRIRQKVVGRPERPRLSVFRSLRHIQAQIIDDTRGVTLAAASTLDPEIREAVRGRKKSEAAGVVGELIARRALERGIRQVVFDRGGYLYHGRIRALAEGARKAGLQF